MLLDLYSAYETFSISGEADGLSFSPSGIFLVGQGALAGTIAGTSTATATLVGNGSLAGTIAGSSTATATLIGNGALAGESDGTSTASATETGTDTAAGESDGTSTATALVIATGSLAGQADGTSTATGTASGGMDAQTSSGGGGGGPPSRPTVKRKIRHEEKLWIAGKSQGFATAIASIDCIAQISGISIGASANAVVIAGNIAATAIAQSASFATGEISSTLTDTPEDEELLMLLFALHRSKAA